MSPRSPSSITNNEATAKVSPAGLITSGERGEAFVMARFDTTTVGCQVIVVPKDLAFTFPQVEERNYVDTLIDDKLKKLRIAPSGLCTDEEFLRRVSHRHHRHAAHRPPSTTTSSPTPIPHKRAKLVDELLAAPRVRRYLGDEMGRAAPDSLRRRRCLLQVRRSSITTGCATRFSQNVPVNELVRQLVSSTGGTFENPAAGFYQFETDPLKLAEDTAQAFLGVQIKCAQCHNHPFDRWTMNDYRGFVAFFTQIARKKGEDPRETIVFDRHEGESVNPITNKVIPPKFLGGAQPAPGPRGSPPAARRLDGRSRQSRSSRNTSPTSSGRNFSGAASSSRWTTCASAIPPRTPPCSMRSRSISSITITTSGSSSATSASRAPTNSPASPTTPTRRTSAISPTAASAACGRRSCSIASARPPGPGINSAACRSGAHAVQIADGTTTNYFLRTFGRATRETPCSCEVSMEPNLSQALHLINGDTVQGKIVGRRRGGENDRRETGRQDDPDQSLSKDAWRARPTDDELKTLTPLLRGCRARTPENAGRYLLGAAEFEGVHVQPLRDSHFQRVRAQVQV